jgi:hypothetical protein
MFSFISKLFTTPATSQPIPTESSSIDVNHTEQIQCDIHIFKDMMTTLSTQEQIKIMTTSGSQYSSSYSESILPILPILPTL